MIKLRFQTITPTKFSGAYSIIKLLFFQTYFCHSTPGQTISSCSLFQDLLAERSSMVAGYEANNQKMMNSVSEKDDILKVCASNID